MMLGMKLFGEKISEQYKNDLKRVAAAVGVIATETILVGEVPGGSLKEVAAYAGGLALGVAIGWKPLMRMTLDRPGHDYFYGDQEELATDLTAERE